MNLEMLKKALQPLEDFGKDEINFEVSGVKVYLKPLLPKEEMPQSQFVCKESSTTLALRPHSEPEMQEHFGQPRSHYYVRLCNQRAGRS